MSTSPRVVQRVLSPARAATRDRLIASAIELADEGGYEAVTIRAVATRAGTSVPTVYQHVSSKDDLLVEALMRLGQESTQHLTASPIAGSTPAERISAMFAKVMKAAHDSPLLYQSLYRAWVVSAPAIVGLEENLGFGPERAPWIGMALREGGVGSHSPKDLDAAEQILSCLFLGALIGVASGRDLDEVVQLLTDASHRLLPDA